MQRNNPLPDFPNGKMFQLLVASRNRFEPPLTDEEVARAEEMIRANPDANEVTASQLVTGTLNLTERRDAWMAKEAKLDQVIDDMTEVVAKHGLFPLVGPRAVASYLFHQIQGATLLFHDLVHDEPEPEAAAE